MMSEDVAAARQIADSNVPLGRFVTDVMLAASLDMLKRHRGDHLDPKFAADQDRFLAVSRATHKLHEVMAEHRYKPEKTPARDVWEACVALGAAAALLATQGDADWEYEPEVRK